MIVEYRPSQNGRGQLVHDSCDPSEFPTYVVLRQLLHKDPEGYFCFDGRKDDICNINGRKISAVRVEQAVLNLGIAEQAAVKPIEKNGRDYLAAWIIPREKTSSVGSQEIRRLLKDTLSEEEIPRYIFFLDAFPVNESGKILKRDLRPVSFER